MESKSLNTWHYLFFTWRWCSSNFKNKLLGLPSIASSRKLHHEHGKVELWLSKRYLIRHMIRWMLKVSSLPDPTGREDSQPQKVIQRSDCHHTESGDHQSRLMHGFRSCLCHLYTSWRLYHLAYAHQAPNTSFEHFRRCEWTFYCLLISVLSHYLVHFSIKRDNRVVLSHTGEICWIWISKSRYYFVEVVQTTLSPDFPSI